VSYNELSMAAANNHPLRVPVGDAGGRLPALVDQALNGEDVVIARDDQAAVRLVPVPSASPRTRPIVGAAKGTVLFMSDDFDAPLDDFADYT
jgi:antitoxin (DNA-binding transcriptional repressor) of toxin-antitoxin stability system